MVINKYKDDGSSTLIAVIPVLKNKAKKGPREIEILSFKKEYTEYDNWVIDQIVREHQRSDECFREPRPHELADIFPEGKPYLNQRRKDINVVLGEVQEDDRKIKAELTKFIDKEKRELLLAINEAKRQRLLDERDQNDTILSFINPRNNTAIKDFQEALARAKDYPIDKLLTFNQNKTECLWHSDSDPSLYYYRKQNRVHCFVCEKGGDSVDVVMQQRGCSISDAIGFLTNS